MSESYSPQKLWNNCLSFIKDNIQSNSEFDIWFKPIKVLELKNKQLTLRVPSHFVYETLEEKYIGLINSALKKEFGKGIRLMYMIDSNSVVNGQVSPPKIEARGVPATNTINNEPSLRLGKSKNLNNAEVDGFNKGYFHPELNSEYTFNNFTEGESNKLARSVALEVAKKPGVTAFNPLFIHSKVGLGKTHLVNAIGLEIKYKLPHKSVIYVPSEKFTGQFVAATMSKDKNKVNDFIHFYQQLDVLIIDDLQFITSKEKTQEALYNIFNYLYQNNKQIVMTADIPPKEMEDIELRLLSRFKWGLTTEIKKPGFVTRKNIILQKTKNLGLSLDVSVIDYLAEKINTNIRDIEGAIISILAESSFNKIPINIDLARSVVSNLINEERRPNKIPFQVIEDIVVQFYNIDNKDLRSKSKRRQIVEPRQVIMYFANKYTNLSMNKIGQQLGKLNHATVIYSIKKVEDYRTSDPLFRNIFEAINEKIKDY